MSVSWWRIGHLWLAAISGVFLFVASITGLILSFEPIYESLKGVRPENESQLNVGDLLSHVKNQYEEVLSIKKDHNGFYQLTAFSDVGESTFYIDPTSGRKIGGLFKTPQVFILCRTLHRSLFFGKLGRFLVGISSFVLLFISLSGLFLVLKKQGGFKGYLKKVIKEDFYQDNHTRIGKISLLLILVISISGTYLFLERFSIISEHPQNHDIDLAELKEYPLLDGQDFTCFRQTSLSDFKELTFPFSDFIDDMYTLKTSDGEMLVNQYTGEVVSSISYTNTQKLSALSFTMHTGEGNPWWAVLLGMGSLSMLFFMYSGYKIYLVRTASKKDFTNPYPKEDCSILVLYGSETGSTLAFAIAVHNAMIDSRQKAYLSSMNDYQYHSGLATLIIMTSTYGVGDPPSNALRFIDTFKTTNHSVPFCYAVLGFGSTKYPDFCKYSIEVDKLIGQEKNISPFLPLKLIDRQSVADFNQWVQKLQNTLGIKLKIELGSVKKKEVQLQVKTIEFSKNPDDHTYLLRLSTHLNNRMDTVRSGDLMVYKSHEDGADRQYSVAMEQDKKTILLSIKRHPEGKVSNYLQSLEKGSNINVSFVSNPKFHFPEEAAHVIFIANGTGIAPFLGMIGNNIKKTPITLFWGGQNQFSLQLYDPYLQRAKSNGRLSSVHTAYSRVGKKSRYVQNIVNEKADLVEKSIKTGGGIMICGSMAMQKDVELVLGNICTNKLGTSLEVLKEKGYLKTDCY